MYLNFQPHSQSALRPCLLHIHMRAAACPISTAAVTPPPHTYGGSQLQPHPTTFETPLRAAAWSAPHTAGRPQRAQHLAAEDRHSYSWPIKAHSGSTTRVTSSSTRPKASHAATPALFDSYSGLRPGLLHPRTHAVLKPRSGLRAGLHHVQHVPNKAALHTPS